MISSPFDNTVGFAIQKTDLLTAEHLLPEERGSLGPKTHPMRVASFVAGRLALRAAYLKLGESFNGPIPRGERGEPQLSNGFVGSLSHSGDCAVAAVARTSTHLALGLDVEKSDRLVKLELARRICVGGESAWVGTDNLRLLRIFSAKEAIYKAYAPIVKRFIGFQEVELIAISNSETLEFAATLPADMQTVSGSESVFVRSMQSDDYLVSAIEIK